MGLSREQLMANDAEVQLWREAVKASGEWGNVGAAEESGPAGGAPTADSSVSPPASSTKPTEAAITPAAVPPAAPAAAPPAA